MVLFLKEHITTRQVYVRFIYMGHLITFVVNWGVKMEDNQKKNVTLYMNSTLYDKYIEYCKKEGLMVSRQIEKFIEGEIKDDN